MIEEFEELKKAAKAARKDAITVEIDHDFETYMGTKHTRLLVYYWGELVHANIITGFWGTPYVSYRRARIVRRQVLRHFRKLAKQDAVYSKYSRLDDTDKSSVST